MVGSLAFEARLETPFEEALERVREALAEQGFGILTSIDVRKTLAEKLGVDFRRYAILGACNPALAHRALSARAEVGLLLPCTVTVEDAPEGGVTVRIADPEVMLGVAGLESDASLREVAADAHRRLALTAAALTGTRAED